MKIKSLTFLLALTFLFLFSGSVFGQEEVKKKFYDSGELEEEIYYENGVHTKTTFWRKSGKKWGEEYYENDNTVRSTIFWEESGKIKEEGYYGYDKFRKKLSGTAFYKSGKKERVTDWKDGKTVRETMFYESGIKKSVKHYKNGKPEGLIKFWFESGKKNSETHYKNGKEEGLVTQWYKNGNKLYEATNKNGNREGLSTWWYQTGQKNSEVNYKNGIREGLETYWYKNGKKIIEKHFKNGKENGLWTEWNEEGKKTFQANFVDGNEQSGKIRTAESSPPQTSIPQPPKSKDVAIATGTGFLFGSQDYIVTNYHVVKGTSEVTVKFLNGESINAEVVARDTQNDVAVLKLSKSPSFQSRAMKFGDSSMVRMGDKVFTIGYPSINIMGFKPKYTEGVISAVTGIKDNPTVFQTTVPIQPGNSGGPLFNEKGEVVGLTTASLSLLAIESMGAIPQSVNYAVKSSFVKNIIETIPEALLSNRGIVVVPTDSNSRADFIEAISKNVVLILGKVDYATPVLAEELHLKCDGTRFGDEFWTNTTFVKIYPEKGQALVQDQMEKDSLGWWMMLKVIRFEKEFIQLAQCETQDCSTSGANHYMIDRVTGRMRNGSFLTDKNGNEDFFALLFWSCSKVKSSF